MRLAILVAVFGFGLSGVVGCSPKVRPLGDEPEGEAGADARPLGGHGGGVMPATGGAGSSTGGAGSSAGPNVGGAGSSTAGEAGAGPAGGSPSECWSPRWRPGEAAPDMTLPGCACEEEESGCPYVCEDGRWSYSLVADCIPGADCQVDGWIYSNHHQRVPTPYDRCNTCRCDDGELTECTPNECAYIGCPAGHYAAQICRECGPSDRCRVLETGCFVDASCEDGTCSSSSCL